MSWNTRIFYLLFYNIIIKKSNQLSNKKTKNIENFNKQKLYIYDIM